MKQFLNNLKSNNKIVVVLVSLMLIGAVGSTIAYFYMKSEYVNIFNTSAYNVSLEEEFYNDWGTKKVSIINKDTTPIIIRVFPSELWHQQGNIVNSTSCKVNTMKLEEGYIFTLSNKVNGEDVVVKEWTESWLNDFTLGSDGWYYYNKILEQDESVQILKSITLNRELIQENTCYQNYNDYNYSLDFNYEAVQATPDAVKEIWGHDVVLSGGNITWSF